jgi:hypothetical protein
MNREKNGGTESAPHPRFRRLFERYDEMRCAEETFAGYCGISRQTLFMSWAKSPCVHVKPKSIAIIKDRTGIDISWPRKRRATP